MSVEWFRGVRQVPVLREAGKHRELLDGYPSVSVIVPARNEGEPVEAALRSVLARLASERPDVLRVIRVEELAQGWLGKNYALYLGARQAEGDWLLFTDADVRFSPGASKRRLVTP
jgi:glycosyltransferase involved in cell wall biosynthesis